ncbi:MAG: hypothetical protein WDW36_001843 [Sanguina aurantia]
MKAQGAPQKLRFTIQAVSGEDSDYPVRELLFHSPQTRGWHSPRFCKYPQEILLRLEQPSKIQQIQILSHEYKIATKVEVFVGGPNPGEPDPSQAALKRLGYLSFDSNERSSHQARELKSVHVNVPAYYVRLTIHRCHVNKLNIYNQVGIIALHLLGCVNPTHSMLFDALCLLFLCARLQVGIIALHLLGCVNPTHSMLFDALCLLFLCARLQVGIIALHLLGCVNPTHSMLSDALCLLFLCARLQVGIIALNLIGEVQAAAPTGPPGFLELHAPITRETPYYNASAAEAADINLDIHIDSVTAAKIRDLVRQKDAAVANEEYDEAKRLKASIDRLKVVGQKIAQLEARKRSAVEKEDYDTAKTIKLDIDKLRAAGEAAATHGGGGGGGGGDTSTMRSKNPDDIFNRVLSHRSASTPGVDPQAPPAQPGSLDEVAVGSAFRQMRNSVNGGPPPPSRAEEYEHEPEMEQESSSSNHHSSKHTAYDERPAIGKGIYGEDGEALGGDGGMGQQPNYVAPTVAPGDIIPPPRGWPADLPPPEPLASAVAKEAELLEDMAGEFVARAAFSKNWQLRDAALMHLAKEAEGGGFNDKRDAFKILMRMVQRGMKDKVANVFLTSVSVFTSLVDMYAPVVGPRDVEAASEAALPLIIDKLGDNNARLRDASKDCIMALAGHKDAGLRNHTNIFCKPIKNQSAWRPVLGILQVLQELVPMVGISKAGDAFDLHELMDFVGRAYGSANAEVRGQAVRVTKEAHDIVGPAIRKFLPKDINPKIKEQVDAVLGGDSSASMPPPPPPAAAAAPSRAAPQRAAAAAPQGGPTGRNAAAAKAPAAAPKGAAQTRAPAAAPSPMPPPQQSQAAPDDPAPFLEELQQRERSLGGDHADVAESCSNLAILYNQRGDTAKALPLYERALKIYEKSYGPHHAEVAHTLTDLAVLHLEQGRDTVGRPLLERALAIQTKALGPDHPDVVAIKDVLNSPDS